MMSNPFVWTLATPFTSSLLESFSPHHVFRGGMLKINQKSVLKPNSRRAPQKWNTETGTLNRNVGRVCIQLSAALLYGS